MRHLWKFALCAMALLSIDYVSAEEESVTTESADVTIASTTTEPEGSPGCNPPDIRLTKPRQRSSMTTTSSPILTFETTQIYLPDDFTTGDLEFINHNKDAIKAAFRNGNTGELLVDDIGVEDDLSLHYVNYSPYTWNDEKKNFEHSKNPSKRTRRTAISFPSSSILKLRRDTHGVLTISETNAAAASLAKNIPRRRRRSLAKSDYEMERIYIQSTDLVSSLQQSPSVFVDGATVSHFNSTSAASSGQYDDNNQIKATNPTNGNNSHPENRASTVGETKKSHEQSNNDGGLRRRVKRKSGKTTGALSRPKSDSGSSSSKTTSRKTQLGVDEETEYRVPHPDGDQVETSKEEETEDLSEGNAFREVTEVRFPSEIGPMGDRRLCKIICSGGKWVGPLCASVDDDEPGTYKFQPLYKSCHVNRIPPHLLLSYRNISVSVGWDVPHGHSLASRCRDLGMYKLLGESRVLCSNGLWAPRMPSCVPTTLLTNYSDDSPPSIRIKVGVGSGSFEPSGVLAVLPSSSVHLDCIYPRRKGNPEWTWTGWFRQYVTGWSVVPEEKATRYRLTIKDIQAQDSGTFTCATHLGLTNSIVIVVAVSICSVIPDPNPPLQLRLEGNKLGQRALYRCPVGYTLEGTANSTCLASGNWSSSTPHCHPVQCPPLYLEEPHLSLVELNSSAWGRAIFKCAWGYRLNGPSALECEPTGVWSGPVPRCRAIQCPQPLVPINGRIDGTSGYNSQRNERRYAVGALVTFSCTEGHLLVGEASIVCTETGFWSHPPPFCKAQCPYPGDPPNGLIAPLKFHYDPGDYLTVQCRPGFVNNNGPSSRPHCLSEGVWSGPVPTCRNYEDV